MIPNQFILQWREHAPWQSLNMVEHDLIISRALIALYNNETITANLAFRGGTALNKLYIRPPVRFSEDIDLVQLKPAPIGTVFNAIRDSLDSWLGVPQRKQTERSAKLIYRYRTFQNEPAKLKIEINTSEHFHVKNLKSINYEMTSNWHTGSASVKTYVLEELMATKLKALYQRRKGRDLFDWWYTLSNNMIDIKSTIPIFNEYCLHAEEEITRALFEKNMSLKKNHKDFSSDMHPLLPSNISWNFETAYDLIMSEVIAKIPDDS